MRTAPISRKLLVPMVVLIILEILLLVGSIFGGGLMSHLKQNSKDILLERVINRKNYLETEMVKNWSNVSDTVKKINAKTEEFIRSGNISIDQLDEGSSYCTPLVLEISENLIAMMRTNRVTGAFVVFNTDDLRALNQDQTYFNKPGIYIRDLDPVSNSAIRNQDLLLEYAPIGVVQNLDISTDSGWRPQFEFKRGGAYSPYFYEPFQNAYETENLNQLDISDLGFWSEPYCLDGDDKEVISYSVPLILEDGTVYGVLGIDLTIDYLKTLLPYEEITEDKEGSYILAVDEEDNLKFRNALINGPVYAQMAGDSPNTVVYTDGGDLKIETSDRTQMYCVVEYLKLYNTNTAFSNQRWALIGTVSENNLFAFSNQIISTLVTAILITLIVGILGSIIISLIISRPVRALTRDMNQADPASGVTLDRTGIREIDKLAESLENLSREVIYSATKFSQIINMASIRLAAFEVNRQDRTIFITDQFFEIFHVKDGNVSSISIPEFQQIMETLEIYKQHRENEQDIYIYKIPNPEQSDAAYSYVKLTASDDGVRCIGLVEDVTSATLEMELIEHERDHDLLTGLINRRAFHRTMKQLFEEGPDTLKTAALIMMDLDNLKAINDTYGHDYGDQYIKSAADCFVSHTPAKTVISRISGDEFYLFFYGYANQDEIRKSLADLSDGIRHTFIRLPDQESCPVRVSGGVAWYPDDSTSYETLMRYSDFAMYKVKQSVKGQLSDFDFGMYNQESYLLQNKAELTELIEKQAVEYYFQPIIKSSTGKVFAYEALMRANMPTLRTPKEIFTLARLELKLDQMESITCFKAMEAYIDCIGRGLISPTCRIFINSIANHILTDEELAEFEEKYLPYLSNIVLEITEEEELREEIREKKKAFLNRWGAAVALDDYGSGYNSEKALLGLVPQYIKIDISIIHQIDTDKNKQKIVDNIISYAHERNMEVIAEGVETILEAVTVVRMGADYLQGFLFAKPAPVPPEIREDIRQAIVNASQEA